MGLDYITPNLWNGIYHPLNFPKPVKLPPKAVSKNLSKSQTNQKNGKSNCFGLQMSRSTQWTYNMVCFSIFFTAMKKNIDLKLQQKIYYIICSIVHYVDLLIWGQHNWIFYFMIFCDLLLFFKTALVSNLTVFGKFRGWYKSFHRLGVCSPPPIGEGVI